MKRPDMRGGQEYFLRGLGGANARAAMTPDGLVIRKGSSLARCLKPSARAWVGRLRERLVGARVLVWADGQLVFAEDFLAHSPTAAATLVLGWSANGRTAWKDAQERTLRQAEETVGADGTAIEGG